MIEDVLQLGRDRDELQLWRELPGAFCCGATSPTRGPGQVVFLGDGLSSALRYCKVHHVHAYCRFSGHVDMCVHVCSRVYC